MSAELVNANAAIHDRIEREYQGFLEHLTALELEPAAAAFARFEHQLYAHMEREEEHVLPVYAGLAVEAGNCLKQVEGDHRILLRVVDAARNAFVKICKAGRPRTALVRDLATFVRVHGVLEHHGERETTLLYPQLERRLTAAQSERLRALLEK